MIFNDLLKNQIGDDSQNNHLLYAGCLNCIYEFDLRNTDVILNKYKRNFTYNYDEINQISINDNGKSLAACDDNGDVVLIDLEKSEIPGKRLHRGASRLMEFMGFQDF